MTYQEIDKLEVESLIKLSVDDLKDEQVIARIEELAEDDQYEAEPMAAREFYDGLEALLVKYGGQINGTDIYKKLFTVKTRLFWQSLPAMDKKLKQECLHVNVVSALKNNIEIASYISSYLGIFEFGVGPDNEERQMFLFALTRNEEAIGTQPIKLKTGETVRNTVTNWIKDYLGYIDPGSLSGESYEMTQYMYSSPNIKALNPADKQLVANALGIYNLLKNPKYIPEIEKEEESVPTSQPVAKISTPPVPPPPPAREAPISTFNTPAPWAYKTPTPPAESPKEMTTFEKRLAQVSAPPETHGADLKALKNRMEQTQTSTAVRSSTKAEEIKREVKTPELPPHTIKAPVQPATPKPTPPVAKPIPPAPIKRNVFYKDNLTEIRNMNDLKKVELTHLRRGPTEQQIEILKAKMVTLAKNNKVIPFYALAAFEESPLFRLYMAHGNALFAGQESSNLTREEFEAIADLRKDIQRM